MTDEPTSSGTETLSGDADTDGGTASTCCSVAEQSTCCDAGEKAGCCGGEATARGGCGCR